MFVVGQSVRLASDKWDIWSDFSLAFNLFEVYHREAIAVGICIAVVFVLLFLGLHPKASVLVGALPSHVRFGRLEIEMDKILHCSAFAILFFVGYIGLDFVALFLYHFMQAASYTALPDSRVRVSGSPLSPPAIVTIEPGVCHTHKLKKATPRVQRPIARMRLGVLVYAIMFCVAIASEYLQHVIAPWRSFDYYDIVANLVGSTAGFILFVVLDGHQSWD